MSESLNRLWPNFSAPRWLAQLEWLLWAAGIACAVWYGVQIVDRHADARRAVDQFMGYHRDAPGAEENVSLHMPVPPPDQRLWSGQRIDAYRNAPVQLSEEPMTGMLRIQRLGLEAPIYQGTSETVLDRGLGWIEETAGIGSGGNVGIAGHRDSFFRPLKEISVEDVIEVVGIDSYDRYKVTQTSIVEPTDVEVLDPTSEPVLTLVTCYPFYFVGHAPKRFIVRAEKI